ncbi:hypothetical protein KSX_04670 [Ktedonospora formicarum]|uniref:Uncharacterized protein n=1 Tax=Ktedonospora formicarum TaxID=2778364 RepID=A0A8J3HYI8_9CHLR|nr:hypothetical protein KSX_04670 [Ktedonospora formicarum]
MHFNYFTDKKRLVKANFFGDAGSQLLVSDDTSFDKPNLIDRVLYKVVEPRVKMVMLPYEERARNIRLIEKGYLRRQAEREATRCLQCACLAV